MNVTSQENVALLSSGSDLSVLTSVLLPIECLIWMDVNKYLNMNNEENNIKFCGLVEQHRVLYDHTMSDYHNRNVSDRAWAKIAQILKTTDEGGGSEQSSSEDEVTEHATRPAPPVMAANAQVPTISVTPHSPGVLEDSLQQLRRLHAAVQRMRAAPLPILGTGSTRLSSSCPSLCKEDLPECGSPTRLEHYPQSRKGSGESRSWAMWGGDEGRRSSWAALEPGAGHPTPRHAALNGHSASLSSMDSEGEAPRPVRHSTHSLNDNDLKKDFEKVTLALRAGELAGAAAAADGRLAARLPLQKSVSTPSIVAAIQPPQPTPVTILSGACASETESDEDTSATLHTVPTGRRNNSHQEHLGLHRLAFLEQASYDHHAEKRRKRGSLFFRKKKDKSRKACHVWQAGGGSGHCDWCSRVLGDTPALYCDNCTMTVHQNICKDYITECNKPKSSKTSVGKSLSASSGKGSKRSSLTGQSQSSNSKKTGSYSPWRRVATKLGVHTSHYPDDKDGSDHKHDQSNASDEACAAEWPEVYLAADQLGDEAAALALGASTEPDTWAAGAPKGLAKQLGDRETKRQEHIYELILTEKHHCLTIRLMQKMFVEGMQRFPGVTSAQVSRMFPRIDELWALHAALLTKLRNRQRASPQVATIADILCDTFAPPNMNKLKSAYGEFCSRHRDAVEVFKECCARDPRLARFIRKCQQNPMLRKKGVPECVLFVAQRLTKYPLLLEPLLKTAGDDVNERELLQRALQGVKEILVDVDNQVAAKEREDRKLEIYHRIDAKSVAHYRGTKFKKSDVLQGNRSLKFEGVATLMQGRSKMQTLFVIVLTDVLFFLHDNNNKYTFFTPDNKTGVVSLVKLLVREKAGAEGRGLYLICSGPAEPEMFELRVHRPKDIHVWIQAIRAAVQQCPQEAVEAETGASAASSAEERARQLEARHENIRLITEELRAKDREHATILEEKMALHMKMVAHAGSSGLDLPTTGVASFPGGLEFPSYVRLCAPPPAVTTHALWQEVAHVVKEALSASSGVWCGGVGLGRSTSSAGERHSVAYESPALPRRADTFAGFDAQRHRGVIPRLSTDTTDHDTETEGRDSEHSTADPSEPRTTPGPSMEPPGPSTEPRLDPKMPQLSGEAALKLQHAIYTLSCIVWHQLTTIHSLEATVSAWRTGSGAPLRAHDAQLEELRHAQARLTTERAHFDAQRQTHQHSLMQEKRQLQLQRQQLEEQQADVEQQRERLYRRLERLERLQRGQDDDITAVRTDDERRTTNKYRGSRGSTGSESSACSGVPLPPPQLLSANNETKAGVRAPAQQIVKQQLPLKLASGAKSQAPPGYHRLHESSTPSEMASGPPPISHTRHGSSPAPLPATPQPNNKATRTNTYPKLPDKFRVRSPPAPEEPPRAPEEEVIYF